MTYALWRLLFFRFFFVYWLLFIFPFPLFGAWIQAYEDLWISIVAWVGEHILRLDEPIRYIATGSGDTLFHYVQHFCFFVFALLMSGVWSMLSRAQEHDNLSRGLRIYLRYFLATVIIGYGAAKVFPVQFAMPGPEYFMMPYSDSSPMGILWRMMSISPGYTALSGVLEVLGGLLLFWRRTTMLGALLVAVVMSNVVALNFFYDVPVKLFSSHLLLMCGFLLLPDMKRLLDFLVLNRATVPAPPREELPLLVDRTRMILKALYIGFILSAHFYIAYSWSSLRESRASFYEVKQFVIEGESLPPTLGDETRWRYVSISERGSFYLRWMDDEQQYFAFEKNSATKTIIIKHPMNPLDASTFQYQEPDEDTLILEGSFRKRWVRVTLEKLELKESELFSRGFHWINERPHYR